MGLAKWVDRRGRATRSAEAALALLRATPGGPLIAFPYRFVDRRVYEPKFETRDLNAAIDAAPVASVPLASLHGIQHTVARARVEQYVRNPRLQRRGTRSPDHGGLVDLPIVVRYRGVNYVHDGHHRATADFYRGGRLLECRFVDLDALLARGAIRQAAA